jgi:hypothetical protein
MVLSSPLDFTFGLKYLSSGSMTLVTRIPVGSSSGRAFQTALTVKHHPPPDTLHAVPGVP